MASYNVSLFKAANKIIRKNRERERNAAQAQQRGAMIGQIGSSISDLIGAYSQRQQLEQQKAASAALGAQFGLDPSVSTAISPQELSKAYLQMKMAERQTPTDIAQADHYKSQAERERWLMTPEGIEATRRYSGNAPKDYTQAHISLGMTPERAAAFRDLAPPTSALYKDQVAPTEAQIAESRRKEIAGSEALTRGQSRYQRWMGGDTAIDPNDQYLVKYRSQLTPDQISGDMRKRLDIEARNAATAQREKSAAEIVALRRELDASTDDRQRIQIAAALEAKMLDHNARFANTLVGNADLLGGTDSAGRLDTTYIRNKTRELMESLSVPQGAPTPSPNEQGILDIFDDASDAEKAEALADPTVSAILRKYGRG